ncbi:putative RNA recognition motif domain-containing protein [Lupinus albus]|uniref:Putative RNA recognition motif domain-containing protein n=1 Tax=Lupinus albus TaxID=3870 RepID=A0A6A4PPP2_LUPAL|nr:putative RNA recognition motif domain-containing protein [Lupinus albus]
MAQLEETPLYIWNIDKNVTDSQLSDLFNQVAQVVSVRISRDFTGESLGSADVHFNNFEDATKALNELNGTPLNNKPIRIVYSTRHINRRGNADNIFVKNLNIHRSIFYELWLFNKLIDLCMCSVMLLMVQNLGKVTDYKQLYDTFSTFGNILSCKIAKDDCGQSKGYGYVRFENEESAQNAIDNFNGKLINDRQVSVTHFLPREDRKSVDSSDTSKFTNLYVKNLSDSLTEDELKIIFGEYGTITSALVMREVDGSSKCFGFVNFENPDSAAKAVEALNGMKFDGKRWYVSKAVTKPDRELELKKIFDSVMKESAEKHQNVKLFIKNLHHSIVSAELKEMFTEFGRVTSHRVIRDKYECSKGYGFVEFSTPEEANRALCAMNGKMVAGRVLFVALAHSNEERRPKLQVMLFSGSTMNYILIYIDASMFETTRRNLH